MPVAQGVWRSPNKKTCHRSCGNRFDSGDAGRSGRVAISWLYCAEIRAMLSGPYGSAKRRETRFSCDVFDPHQKVKQVMLQKHGTLLSCQGHQVRWMMFEFVWSIIRFCWARPHRKGGVRGGWHEESCCIRQAWNAYLFSGLTNPASRAGCQVCRRLVSQFPSLGRWQREITWIDARILP